MEGLFTLLCLSLLMAVVSFIVGSVPLTFTLSSSRLRLVSALGMGVLVGTSLIVIIPEGVETLYSSTSVSTHVPPKRDTAAQGADVRWETRSSLPVLNNADDNEKHSVSRSVGDNSNDHFARVARDDSEEEDSKDGEKTPTEDADEGGKSDGKEEGHEHKEGSPHVWIGIGLVSGFLLMYLIDQLPQFASLSSNQQQRPYHISLDNLSSGLGRGPSPARSGVLDFNSNSSKKSQGFAATMGLVIHAAADGIALGASTSDTSLSFIIFLAIMVHKAPASFGLTTALLKQGVSNRAARTHLLIFSLAAPVGALATWLVAHTVMASHAGDEQSTRWKTGMLLIFSAGTFLYVAIHTMQDSVTEGSRRDSNANGYLDGRESTQRPKKSAKELAASVLGMLLPLFLQIGHAH